MGAGPPRRAGRVQPGGRCHPGLCPRGSDGMNCRLWVLPGVGRAAALRGGWGGPDEGMELHSIPLGHPWGLATGDCRAGAKQGLIAVRGRVVDEPVLVLLPRGDAGGAAPGGRGYWGCSQAPSCASRSFLHPGRVKVWQSGPGACWASKQCLVHIRCLGPAARPWVQSLHPPNSHLHWSLQAARGLQPQ